MKKRLQGFIAGTLVGIMVAGGTVLATNSTTLYNVITEGISIIIDGNKLIPKDANGNVVEPMIYNGTTYLPVRAVANAFDKNVSWDGNTQTVYLGEMPKTASKDICVMKSITMKMEDSDGTILTDTTEYSYDEVAELSNGIIVLHGKEKKSDGTTMPVRFAYTKDGILVGRREFDENNNTTDWTPCLEDRTLTSFEKQERFSYIEKLTSTGNNEQYKV